MDDTFDLLVNNRKVKRVEPEPEKVKTIEDIDDNQEILNLLKDIQDELHLTMLFISHDLPLIRQMCNRIIVLKNGAVCETKDTEELFNNPEHEYTKELIRLMPKIESII